MNGRVFTFARRYDHLIPKENQLRPKEGHSISSSSTSLDTPQTSVRESDNGEGPNSALSSENNFFTGSGVQRIEKGNREQNRHPVQGARQGGEREGAQAEDQPGVRTKSWNLKKRLCKCGEFDW